jgi:hypothetical protein
MLVVWAERGISSLEPLTPATVYDWDRVLESACQLLEGQSNRGLADFVRRSGFSPRHASNSDGENFNVIVAEVDNLEYGRITKLMPDDQWRCDFASAAKALAEVGFRIKAIAVARQMSTTPSVVDTPHPRITNTAVARALDDASVLIRRIGPSSAVDRIHTSFHGHLKEVCDRAGLPYSKDAGVSELFKVLREQHPKFRATSAHAKEMERILKAMATIVDTVGTLRNRASGAHPNPDALSDNDATLVINIVKSLLSYIDSKAV